MLLGKIKELFIKNNPQPKKNCLLESNITYTKIFSRNVTNFSLLFINRLKGVFPVWK